MKIEILHQFFLNSSGITTDTRKIGAGQIFFALKGANFNANKFASEAIKKGASYAVIDEAEFALNDKFILVDNVLSCLQELAKYHRKHLNIPIIGITGTNGKTTTKELISSVLQKKFNLGFTFGNLNNHIGVPLTLLSFNNQTEIGVVEMGANHQGEIAQLCEIARPDYGIITNIGKAHIEGFGSFDGVIKAKSELYNYLKINQKPVFVNGDDKLLTNLAEGMVIHTYGKNSGFTIKADFAGASPFLRIKWKEHLIETKLVGEYNLNNVIAAICVGSFFKVPDTSIVSALSNYQPQNNRSQLLKTDKNTLIIDAYNANPTSMDLAIRNFLNVKEKNKVLILGDMFELGNSGYEEHKKIINLIAELKFESTFFIGEHFYRFSGQSNPDFRFFKDTDRLCNYLSENRLNNKTILLKASRGIQLEKVIDYL